MHVLRPYFAVLRTPGALAFSSVGAFARLPISMVGLGTVLLISLTRGSYALAGGLSALMALSQAAVGPFMARWTDRHGQHRTAPPLICIQVTCLLLFAVAATAMAPIWVLAILAALGGAAAPSFGNYVRARWSYALNDRDLLHTAFAYESIIDEIVFILGPPLATALAISVMPSAALVVSAALIGTFGLWLATMRGTEPPPAPAIAGPRRPVLAMRGMAVLTGSFIMVGAVFGSFEVVTVAFAEEHGVRPYTGALLGAYALGSMISGIAIGGRRAARRPHRRYLIALVALALGTAPLMIVPNAALLGVAAFLAGMAVSPVIITGFSLVEMIVPEGRLTEGLMWPNSGMAVGLAGASALAGWVIDTYDAHTAYAVTAGAAALAASLGVIGYRTLIPQQG